MTHFYDDLADWWPLFSPPEHYAEEAADLLQRVGPVSDRATLLELGSGGGSLASHLQPYFTLTLTDRSAAMLDNSRRINPGAEHIVSDMRTLRLGRRFDLVLVHDAIMYATTPADVKAALQTAASHCRPDGRVVVLPDFVRETFTARHRRGRTRRERRARIAVPGVALGPGPFRRHLHRRLCVPPSRHVRRGQSRPRSARGGPLPSSAVARLVPGGWSLGDELARSVGKRRLSCASTLQMNRSSANSAAARRRVDEVGLSHRCYSRGPQAKESRLSVTKI